MSLPTTGIGFSPTAPAAPAGYANAIPQGDNGTPQEKFSFYAPNVGGVSAKTTNYTATAADCGKLLSFNSTSAVTLTLPSSAPFAAWNIAVENIGAGALTVSPGSLTLDGSVSSLTFQQNQGCYVATDGSNYFTERGAASGGGVSSLTTTGTSGAATLASGVLNIPVYSGGSGGSGLFAGLIHVPTLSSFPTAYHQSGSFIAANNPIGIGLSEPTLGGSDNWEGVAAAYPSSPFTWTILKSRGSINGGIGGMAILSSLTGNLMALFVDDKTNTIKVASYSSPTAYSATYYQFGPVSFGFYWLRLQDDGTNLYFSFSLDGIFWTLAYQVAKTASFLASSGFNYLALVHDSYNGAGGNFTCMSSLITNP